MSWLRKIFAAPAPASAPTGDPVRVAEVEAVLVELRPLLRLDGGDVALLAVEDGVVRVRLQGACTSCSSQGMTLQGAVEPRLRERLPWVSGVREG